MAVEKPKTNQHLNTSGLKSKALSLALLLAAILVPHLSAQSFNYYENFSYFGQQTNMTLNGICAAVSTLNAFVFLENQYPTVYGNPNTPGLLTPNYNAANTNDPIDSMNFAWNGWKVGANPQRTGYYSRTGDANSTYLDALTEWFGDYAPSTSIFDSWYLGSAQHDMNPTAGSLAQVIKNNMGAEFFVLGISDTNFNHALTLTGVSCDNSGKYSITWQDPNDPGLSTFSSIVTTDTNGQMQITGVAYAGGAVDIYGAFSEAPVPEPSSLALLALGLGVMRIWRVRRKKQGSSLFSVGEDR